MKRFVILGSLAVASCTLSACSDSIDTSAEETEADSLSQQRHPKPAQDSSDPNDDGIPNRKACTNDFGSGLSGTFGRLDGYVVAVVPPGRGSCNADRHHVHVQVLSEGQTYDIAVNTDAGFIAEKEAPLPGSPWAEGWHRGGSLDYPADLGLHASDFSEGSEPELTEKLETALAKANHISVFATLYSHGGAHLVHRRGRGADGVVVTNPLSPSAHVFAFHFAKQTF